jgi:hypothetical protein
MKKDGDFEHGNIRLLKNGTWNCHQSHQSLVGTIKNICSCSNQKHRLYQETRGFKYEHQFEQSNTVVYIYMF